ncbi:hypothetical protein M2139_001647 [Enterococcus sp. PF1-24]|uniref:DUF2316 family protein n=1 Tax=unclassified Enterococcus TaxID=2608891 RepID=UPI002476F359|nr:MULTISPECIES: DUF2316 family protein [unclassified Enterococcus]MDH6364660.1 hypothetical protein [Enterococcus sp. PFB1-1]MDH6401761.1 hypothetical protein [Enterococcus sp. PF1-24]
MSLSPRQMVDTRKQFRQNFKLADLSLDEIAADLYTTPNMISEILNLKVDRLEDPWILKIYLEDRITQQGLVPVPFTALSHDYHQLWFLDSHYIDEMRIGY